MWIGKQTDTPANVYSAIRSTFFHYGLGLEGNASSVLDADERGEAQISLLAAPEIGFHYELSFFKSGNTAVNVDGAGKVSDGLHIGLDQPQFKALFIYHSSQMTPATVLHCTVRR